MVDFIATRATLYTLWQIEPKTKPAKAFDAVDIGRHGGLKGSEARAAILTPARRVEIVEKAARAG
jgi:hypothetical protein